MANTILFKGQRGFTLIELMAVIAILTVLAGIVAAGTVGLGAGGQAAKLEGDANTISKAANRFATDAFPEAYPIKRPAELVVAGIDTVGVINFNANLPQDPTRKFVPKYLAQVPDSAGLVSWRIDTATGKVFFADDAARLVLPSTNELDVSPVGTPAVAAVVGVADDPATTNVNEFVAAVAAVAAVAGSTPNAQVDYTLGLRMKKNEAALKTMKMEIPAGYVIGGTGIASGTLVGTLAGKFHTDNPWKSGQEISYTGTLKTTALTHQWILNVAYDTNSCTTGPSCSNVNVKDQRAISSNPDTRNHTVEITAPGAEVGGQMTLTIDRGADLDQNEATETFTLTLLGKVGGVNIITNPAVVKVYRWLAKEHTAMDSVVAQKEVFNAVTGGNQAVVIK